MSLSDKAVGMTEEQSHSGLRIAEASLTDARFQDVTVARASFWRIRMRGVWVDEVEIDGHIGGLRINGVDVGPLIEAELDRRHPLRAKMRPADVAGFREAWDIVESLWAGTVDRARALPPELLHERVDGEWSFIQTLRHLLFATDIWVRRAILGDPTPWHPLSLPFDEMEPDPAVPWDLDARPSLDEVLALRADRMATVRRVIEGLTVEALAGNTEPVDGPGYPRARQLPGCGMSGHGAQRGVAAPPLRGAGPRRPRGTVLESHPADALNDERAGPSRCRSQLTSAFVLVGVTGFEPATSSSRTKRATKLRHTPMARSLRAGNESSRRPPAHRAWPPPLHRRSTGRGRGSAGSLPGDSEAAGRRETCPAPRTRAAACGRPTERRRGRGSGPCRSS